MSFNFILGGYAGAVIFSLLSVLFWLRYNLHVFPPLSSHWLALCTSFGAVCLRFGLKFDVSNCLCVGS